ncbi:6242_t:CDS:2 [Ambispora leptoticha]|uniref:Sensitive to high expression protein 9, mitochondrial n=1 Tax=Ambispora leptoticha TaxID=144679 RepID=A0A9N8YMV9_9GLOM|nr:6242_t:CDS:2 [Ambispora leptoticha]
MVTYGRKLLGTYTDRNKENRLPLSPTYPDSPSSQAACSLTKPREHNQVLSQIKQVREKPWFEHMRELQDAIKTKDRREALSAASRALNEFTGYSDVEKLKEKVIKQENEFFETRQRLNLAKRAYEDAISARSATQHEINDLLQRKHQWTNEDVTRFTELYRIEHLNEQAESAAKDEYLECEKQVEKEYTELTKSIMMRYHEEQIWSDKIRSASTYGTIGLMALNVVLFICVQTVFEPMKRQKLADKFEELLLTKFNSNVGTSSPPIAPVGAANNHSNGNERDGGITSEQLVSIIDLVKGQEDKIDEMVQLQKSLLLENTLIKDNIVVPPLDEQNPKTLIKAGAADAKDIEGRMFGTGFIVGAIVGALITKLWTSLNR